MDRSWSCPRCGDLESERVRLWTGVQVCTDCCRRVLGAELCERLTGSPRLTVNERRRMPRRGYAFVAGTLLVMALIWGGLGGIIGAFLCALIGLPIAIYLVYLAGWERVHFENRTVLVETPLGRREYTDVELIDWHIYARESKQRYSSDSFLRFRTPARQKPITLRLWGDRNALDELRRTLLLTAPDLEEAGLVAQLLPGMSKVGTAEE